MRDDYHRTEVQLDRDRAALAAALAALRGRVSPAGLMAQGAGLMTRGLWGAARDAARGNPLATALSGAGALWFGLGGQRKAPDTPPDAPWMAEADLLHDRADAMTDEIDAALDNGTLADRDAREARDEIRAALAKDLVGVLAQGLEGLSPAERDAALAVRERVAAERYALAPGGGVLGRHPVLGGLLAAGAMAAAAALFAPRRSRRESAQMDALLRDLDRAQDRLDALTDRLSDRAGR